MSRASQSTRMVVGALLGTWLALAPCHGGLAAEEPLRIGPALGVPPGVRLGLEQRSRFEHLENEFHASAGPNATALVLRTLVFAEFSAGPWALGLELQDARAFAREGTPLSPTLVNAAEPLRAYLAYRTHDVWAAHDTLAVSAGRLTLDLGSRRLAARNAYRNTINGFTGLHVDWRAATQQVTCFAVMPVERSPTGLDALANNAFALDREATGALFWGALASSAVGAGIALELYVFALHEADRAEQPSRNRRLFTPGGRLFRQPTAGAFDFQLELMLQRGRSRESVAGSDVADLRHEASFVHAAFGYEARLAPRPRLILVYDRASGDGDPTDRVNGRFDTLFGARRFDLGPTSLWGALARSNLESPGLAFNLTPHERLDAFGTFRLAYLASARDAWGPAGLRDPTGAAGRFIGQQFEAGIRWQVVPGNLSLELGAAILWRGRFAKTAPGARPGDPLYVYSQVTGTL